MDARGDLDGIVRRHAQVRLHAGGASEVGIVLSRHVAIPVGERLCQGRGIDIQLFGQPLDGVGLHRDAGGDVFFNGLQAVAQALVENDVGIASGLLEFARGDNVAGLQFIDEAFAVLIDQDRAVAAHALGDEHARALLNGGMELDLLDVYQIGSHGLSHDDAVAHDAGSAGGDRAEQVGTITDDHLLVVAETARGQHDGLRMDRIDGRVALGHHADHSAVDSHELRGRCVIVYGDLQLGESVQEARHQEGAHAGAVLGRVDAPVGGAAGEGHLRQRRADGVEPVNGPGGHLRHHRHESAVVDVVAGLHRVLHEYLHGVLDSLLGLIMGLGRVHTAGGLGGVAAHIGHFLQDDDILAGLLGLDGGRHARAAGSDHDDIHFHRLVGADTAGRLLGRREGGEVRSRLSEGVLKRSQDRAAGDCGAGDHVHVRRLLRHDAVAQHGYGKGTDVLGLVAAVDVQVKNIVLIHGDRNGDVAAEALGRAGVGSGNVPVSVGSFRAGLDSGAHRLGSRGRRGRAHRIGGEGRAGNDVHIASLSGEHRFGQIRDRRSAHAGRLAVSGNGNIGNAAVAANGESYADRAAESVGRSGVGAGGVLSFGLGGSSRGRGSGELGVHRLQAEKHRESHRQRDQSEDDPLFAVVHWFSSINLDNMDNAG